MLVRHRLIPLVCALALLPAAVALASPHAPAPFAAKKGKKKHCPKGYKPKTVNKHGKKVRKCVKVLAPGPPPDPGNAPLFEPPGHQLVGNDAVPFLQRYLYNSRFTDCPAGWPNCGVVEERYSHFSDGSFYYCRLGPTPGSDIRFSSEYQVQNAVVEADGSWTFNELVPSGGNPSTYEWHVTVNGVVTGAYQFNGGAVEQLGPLQYVSGARDCSY